VFFIQTLREESAQEISADSTEPEESKESDRSEEPLQSQISEESTPQPVPNDVQKQKGVPEGSCDRAVSNGTTLTDRKRTENC